MLFISPRLSTIWSPLLKPLPRWLRCQGFPEATEDLPRETGSLSGDPLSYDESPTWRGLAPAALGVEATTDTLGALPDQSVLGRLIASIAPMMERFSDQAEEYRKRCAFQPYLGQPYFLWEVPYGDVVPITSVEIMVGDAYYEIRKSIGEADFLTANEPTWYYNLGGVYISGLHLVDDVATISSGYLYVPTISDVEEGTSVWVQHPATSLWVEVPGWAVGSNGRLPMYLEGTASGPPIRYQSIAALSSLSAPTIRINFDQVLTSFRQTLWNDTDELGIEFDVYRTDLEPNTNFFRRLRAFLMFGRDASRDGLSGGVGSILSFYTTFTATGRVAGTFATAPASTTLGLVYDVPRTGFLDESALRLVAPFTYRTRYEAPVPPSQGFIQDVHVALTQYGGSGIVVVAENTAPSGVLDTRWSLPFWTSDSSAMWFSLNMPGGPWECVWIQGVVAREPTDTESRDVFTRLEPVHFWRATQKGYLTGVRGLAEFE